MPLGVQVRTYDVIPVSPSVGLMAFVPDTRQLQSVIEDIVGKEDISAADVAYKK